MLQQQKKHVTIIGGGISGLTAAELLARRGIGVTILEKAPELGGHAAMLGCKAKRSAILRIPE